MTKTTLNADDEIETLAQLELAIKRIGEFDSTTQIVEAELNQEISELRAKHGQRLMIGRGKKARPIADVRAELLGKIESFCWANRDELLTGKVKFKQLAYGRVGWAKTPDKFDLSAALVEGSASSVLLDGVLKAVCAFVNTIATVLWGCPISTFIDVKVSWNGKAIKKAIEANAIDRELAAEAGFVIVEGMDTFYCEPKTA